MRRQALAAAAKDAKLSHLRRNMQSLEAKLIHAMQTNADRYSKWTGIAFFCQQQTEKIWFGNRRVLRQIAACQQQLAMRFGISALPHSTVQPFLPDYMLPVPVIANCLVACSLHPLSMLHCTQYSPDFG